MKSKMLACLTSPLKDVKPDVKDFSMFDMPLTHQRYSKVGFIFDFGFDVRLR